MRYGKIDSGSYPVEHEKKALLDLLEKQEITKEEYTSKLKDLQKRAMSYLVATNGGYNLSKKQMKKMNSSLRKLSDITAQREAAYGLEYRDAYLKALEEQKQEPAEENSEAQN